MKNMQHFPLCHAVLFLATAFLCLPLAGQDSTFSPPPDGAYGSGGGEMYRLGGWTADGFLEALQEEIAQEEGFSTALWEENRDGLEALLANPLDLNRATRRELEQIPFLTAPQAEELLDYRARHGAFRSLQELQLLKTFDRRTLRLVAPFLRVGPAGSQPGRGKRFSLRGARHEVRLQASVPLYEREGYRPKTIPELMANPNAHYLGPPVSHSLRYSLRLGDWLQAGMTASNDAGEPFFKGGNRKGYDSYSFYLLYRGGGFLHSLALGKYRIDLGQGLVMGNGFLSSKGASLPVAGLGRGKLRAHASTDEYRYLNGAALVVEPLRQRLRLTAFYSYRALDGRVEGDTLLSISDDGFHRLPREMERRRVAAVQAAGGAVQYLGTSFEVGLNAVGYFFSKAYVPESRYYNTYYFRGRRGYNLSADYRLALRGGMQLAGEIAFDPDGRTALLQSFRMRLPGEWQAVALYRRYDKRYKSFYARSFSEGGYVQNEEGCYIGAEGMLPGQVLLTVYADLFRFPYAKYNVSTSSHGYDLMAKADWTAGKVWRVEAYYRYKEKGKNLSSSALEGEERTQVNPYATHRAKLQLHCTPRGEEIQLKTSLMFTSAGHRRGHRRSTGWLMGQAAQWKPRRLPVRVGAGMHYFHAGSYDARLYAYEYSLPYTFSVLSFYGRGVRCHAVLRCDLWKGRVALVGKYGLTRYFDREEISSGLQLIRSSAKQDIDLMFRFKW